MRLISPASFVTMPWKNGGGITHEVLRHGDGDDFNWRLSIAEVRSDGPFSKFVGMERILTVIDGEGLVLTAGTDRLEAGPFEPVRFFGELAINGWRVAGDVLDFNVIFKASDFEASVDVADAGALHIAPPVPHHFKAMLTVGAANVNGVDVAARSLCIFEGEDAVCHTEGFALIVDIWPRDTTIRNGT